VVTARPEAPPRPEVVDAEYMLRRIGAHLRGLPVEDRPAMRYFSLHHLRAAGADRAELDRQRAALTRTLQELARDRAAVRLTAIEPTQTVFGVDLRELGWDQSPFEPVAGRRTLNRFDLFLLEYPHGTVPEASAAFAPLVDEFLEPAGLVRPIPFVRADWFVRAAGRPPFGEAKRADRPAAQGLEERLPDPGRRLVPLDGLTLRDFAPQPPPFFVELTTSKKDNVFAVGDELAIFATNRSPQDIFIELIGTSARGRKVILAAPTRLPAGQRYRYPAEGRVLRVQGEPGTEQVTLFACATEFPAGELFRGQGWRTGWYIRSTSWSGAAGASGSALTRPGW
jgi:hypothetical protein